MAKRYQDKYYTPASVVKAVLKVIEKEIMPLDKFNRIIEPSAGAGAFIKELPESTISYDIAYLVRLQPPSVSVSPPGLRGNSP